jgi:hypothetical protein
MGVTCTRRIAVSDRAFALSPEEGIVMPPRVKSVVPWPEFPLLLTFDIAERRVFDLGSYLAKGVFAELTDESLFRSVRVSFDTVEWSNGVDLCPEVLYAESEPAERVVGGKSGHSVG